jgi:hypothetical protein
LFVDYIRLDFNLQSTMPWNECPKGS